jgi:hypothetical protein
MTVTINGTTGITTPALDNQGNLTVDGGTIKLDGNYPVGAGNVALGDVALSTLSTGVQNTAIGNLAGATTNAAYLTAVGYQAARYNTGDGNTAIGTNALITSGAGYNNVAVGKDSLYSNTSGTNNTAVGFQSLLSNANGSSNTAVGYQAASTNIGGYNLVAIGQNSLNSNSTGHGNIGIGVVSLLSNTSGINNVAIGNEALRLNDTGSSNTAVGYQAGYSNVGLNSTFIGYRAGYNNVTTGGTTNCFVGYNSGSEITTGYANTIIGSYNGNQGGLDIRTSATSGNIVLSDGNGNPRMYIGSAPYLSCPAVYGFPVAGRDVYVDSNGTIGYLSSTRQSKTNIEDLTDVSWLLNLEPKQFNYRKKDADTNYLDTFETDKHYGFIADEVEAINPELCFYNETDAGQELAGVSYTKIMAPLLKLVQEQQATITALTARITALEGN